MGYNHSAIGSCIPQERGIILTCDFIDILRAY
jgi:hypothetical protein